jgi:plastocyanin
MRARYGLAAVLVAGAGFTGCGGGGGGASVEVKGFRFQPARISIGTGESVAWTQTDNTIHTITSGVPGSPDGEFDHRDFGQGETFSHVFSKARTYEYFCSIHDSMTGTVTVN